MMIEMRNDQAGFHLLSTDNAASKRICLEGDSTCFALAALSEQSFSLKILRAHAREHSPKEPSLQPLGHFEYAVSKA